MIHDKTLYDYPSYNAAYQRSLEGVTAILKENPSIVLLLDVHRDALVASDGTIYKVVAGSKLGCPSGPPPIPKSAAHGRTRYYTRKNGVRQGSCPGPAGGR